MTDFEKVADHLEKQFIDLELQILTIIKFEFNFDYGTPFSFINMFLQDHFARLTFNFTPEQIEDFGKNYF